jgi:hypothetical protein
MSLPQFSSLLKRIETSSINATDMSHIWAEVRRILKSNDAAERSRGFLVLKNCIRHQTKSVPSLRLEILETLKLHLGDWLHKQEVVRLLVDTVTDAATLHKFVASSQLGRLLVQWLFETSAKEYIVQILVRLFKRCYTSLAPDTVVRLTNKICDDCNEGLDLAGVSKPSSISTSMRMADVIVRYGELPVSCIDHFNKTLCRMVNVQSTESWRLMQNLLRCPSRGTIVQYSLLKMLDKPEKVMPQASRSGILRGAVFFVGMSAWGSQRVESLRSPYIAILPSLRDVLANNDRVVMYEVLLSLQRLVRKYGAGLRIEWDIVLEILKIIQPCVLGHDGDGCKQRRRFSLESPSSERLRQATILSDEENQEKDTVPSKHRSFEEKRKKKIKTGLTQSLTRDLRKLGVRVDRPPTPDAVSPVLSPNAPPRAANIESVKTPEPIAGIPRPQFVAEIVKIFNVIQALQKENTFLGSYDMYFTVLEGYLSILPLSAQHLLLGHKLQLAHPSSFRWLDSLEDLVQTFLVDQTGDTGVRKEALNAVNEVLRSSDHAADEEITNRIILPYMGNIYNDADPTIRRSGLDFLTEAARQEYFHCFEETVKILERAVHNSEHEDARVHAMKGIVSLLSSAIEGVPASRATLLLECVFSSLGHSDILVRHSCLNAILCLKANSSNQVQWVAHRVRTSQFLWSSGETNFDFISVLEMPRLFGMLVERLGAEQEVDLVEMAVRTVLSMLKNRFIVKMVPLGTLTTHVCQLLGRLVDGRLTKFTYSRRNEGDEMTLASPSVQPDGGHKNARNGQLPTGAGSTPSSVVGGVRNLYKMLLSPVTSPVMSPDNTPQESPVRNRIEHSLDDSLEAIDTPRPPSRSVISREGSNRLGSPESEIYFDATVTKATAVCLDVLNVLTGSSKLLPFGKQIEIFESFMAVLIGVNKLGLPRPENYHVGVAVNHLPTAGLSKVLQGLCLQIIVTPDVSTQHLGSIIHSLHRYAMILSRNPVEDSSAFVAIMSFCRTLVSSSKAVVGKTITENHFLDLIDTVLVYLSWSIFAKENNEGVTEQEQHGPSSGGSFLGKYEYLLSFTYHTLAVCITACPQHLRVRYAPDITERLGALKLASSDGTLTAVIDVLLDLVNRYTYMTVNSLPLSLPYKRTADNEYMFPPNVTHEASYMCGQTIMTIRMGIRGVSEMTVRCSTGASQWLMQSQQENLSVSLHPLLRLMPATLMNSIASFHQHRYKPCKIGPPSLCSSPRGVPSRQQSTDSANTCNSPTLNFASNVHGKASDIELPPRGSPPLLTDQFLVEERCSHVTSSHVAVESAHRFQRPRSSSDNLLLVKHARHTLQCGLVDADGVTDSLGEDDDGEMPLDKRRLGTSLQEGGVLINRSTAFTSLGEQRANLSEESKLLIMQMDLGPPKSRYRARVLSEGQEMPAKDSRATSPSSEIAAAEASPSRQASEIDVEVLPMVNSTDVTVSPGIPKKPIMGLSYVETERNLYGKVADVAEGLAMVTKKPVSDAGTAMEANTGHPVSPVASPQAPMTLVASTESILESSMPNPNVGNTPTPLGVHHSTPAELCDNLRRAPPNVLDPGFLMSHMRAFGRQDVHPLKQCNALKRSFNVLDRTPCAETHKIGLIYVPKGAASEVDILSTNKGSPAFLKLMARFGRFVKLSECDHQGVYSGGLDCRTGSDGEFGLAWRNECSQVMFHSTILMSASSTAGSSVPSSPAPEGRAPSRNSAAPSPAATSQLLQNKKRHVGNDNVHIVYNENSCVDEFPYQQETISGQFNYVHIVIRPLDNNLYHVEVLAKQDVPPFGPLEKGSHVLASESLVPFVRETALQADLACRFLHGSMMEEPGILSNTMERFVQIERIGSRYGPGSEK